MGFLLGLAVGLFVGIFSMLSMVLLNGVDGASGWAQFIGGTCAVAVAVYIPLKIKSEERAAVHADRTMRAKFMALAIYPEIREVRAHATGSIKFLDDCKADRNDLFGSDDPAIFEARVPITEGLIRNYPQLHLLGTAIAGDVLQLIALCEQLNRAIDLKGQKIMHTSVLKPFPPAIVQLCDAIIPPLEQLHR
jgi:hypothetical protein